jgi:hypothetical protein
VRAEGGERQTVAASQPVVLVMDMSFPCVNGRGELRDVQEPCSLQGSGNSSASSTRELRAGVHTSARLIAAPMMPAGGRHGRGGARRDAAGVEPRA